MSFLRKDASPEMVHQVGILLYILDRDRHLRRGMGTILSITVFAFADTRHAIALTCALIIAEIYSYLVTTARFEKPMRFSNLFVTAVIVSEIYAAFAFAAPTLALVSSPEFPVRLMGMIWVLGVAGYTSNAHASTYYFYWINFVPPVITIFWAVYILYQPSGSVLSLYEWGTLCLFLVLYLVNSLNALYHQRDTHKALTKARKEAHARMVELEYLSQSDPLTSLANRTAFDEKLSSILKSSTKPKHDIVVCIIDLDEFKPINDSFGHQAGDALLIEVASRLEEFVKGRGFAARLGGDEFALVLRNIHSQEDAKKMGQDLWEILCEPFSYQNEEIAIAGSVGISRVADVGAELSTLCKSADQAMYQAKKLNGQSVIVYNAATARPVVSLKEKAVIETALIRGDIKPYYQPQVDMLTGRILGLEALARWDDPKKGVIMPGAFLPKIEELKLTHMFNFAMVRRALRDIEIWQSQGIEFDTVSVNLDEKTLATQIGIQDLIWLISEHQAAAKLLTLEVTEDVVLARSGEFIRRSIESLVDQGVRISLDDFGTGFASFRHLQQLKLHELKIDTSFVTTIGKDPVSKVIIEGFLSIAAGLDISVVAEGVETEAQKNFLLERGCHIGQGFLFSKAVPASDISDYFQIEKSGHLLIA